MNFESILEIPGDWDIWERIDLLAFKVPDRDTDCSSPSAGR